MAIQITIHGDTATEAIRELSLLAAGIQGQSVTDVEQKETEKPKRQLTTKTEPEKKQESRTSSPVEEQGEAEEPTDSSNGTEAVEEISDVELRAKASTIAKSGKRAEVKALLNEFGVPNITEIPQEKRAEFMSRLEEL